MANKDFKKIERVIKDFSLDVGEGKSNTTHILFFIDREARQKGDLQIYYNDEQIELKPITSPSYTNAYDVELPFNEEITIKYKAKTGAGTYFFNGDYKGDFTSLGDKNYEAKYTFEYGGVFAFADTMFE